MDRKEANPLGNLSQIGFVVRDIDKLVEEMRRVLKVEPTTVIDFVPKKVDYYGAPANSTARIAFYEFCNVQLEFIQPVNGESIWRDFLNQGKEGLHHIRFSVDDEDFEQMHKNMAESDINPCQEGHSVVSPGKRWCYFDTEDSLGFVVEVFNQFGKKAEE